MGGTTGVAGSSGTTGLAGSGIAGTGGGSPPLDLPGCLRDLFATCSITGACTYQPSDAGTSPRLCHASGASSVTTGSVCSTMGGGQTIVVSKADGSVCYTLFHLGDTSQACESETYRWNDASGALVATATVRGSDPISGGVKVGCGGGAEISISMKFWEDGRALRSRHLHPRRLPVTANPAGVAIPVHAAPRSRPANGDREPGSGSSNSRRRAGDSIARSPGPVYLAEDDDVVDEDHGRRRCRRGAGVGSRVGGAADRTSPRPRRRRRPRPRPPPHRSRRQALPRRPSTRRPSWILDAHLD